MHTARINPFGFSLILVILVYAGYMINQTTRWYTTYISLVLVDTGRYRSIQVDTGQIRLCLNALLGGHEVTQQRLGPRTYLCSTWALTIQALSHIYMGMGKGGTSMLWWTPLLISADYYDCVGSDARVLIDWLTDWLVHGCRSISLLANHSRELNQIKLDWKKGI